MKTNASLPELYKIERIRAKSKTKMESVNRIPRDSQSSGTFLGMARNGLKRHVALDADWLRWV